jgi:mannose-6-phosphate isomerase-like protein (cupin superfamily)
MDKVVIRRLPLLEAPPASPILDGVRIRMPAGEAAPVYNGGPWRFISYLEFLAGTGLWRGNHYHERKREYVYVISGTVLGAFEDIDSGERLEVDLPAGTTVLIEPRCAHAFREQGYAQAFECAPLEFDADDAFPFVVGR